MKRTITLILFLLVACKEAKFEDSADFKKAESIFKGNCAACHGLEGYGDGPASTSFNPGPRNFHLPSEAWVNGKSEEGIQKTLREGVMPNMWAYNGDPKDIPLLAKYILHVGSK
jgi:mono/diheme cytochrome c family protein